MSESIFKISQELQGIINDIIDAGGEITPETEANLSIKKDELSSKSESYGYVIRKMEYDVNIIDQEIIRLNQIKKSRKNTIDRLKNVLSFTMTNFDVPEIVTPTMKISFRKSSTLEITDESKIPKKYIVQKVTSSISKAEIKKAIKEGEIIEGAEIIENQNLQIK
tara:strand:+ start:5552 stop:6046 length:495 start_codon:yes stop_codon:yes gene_type:complete